MRPLCLLPAVLLAGCPETSASRDPASLASRIDPTIVTTLCDSTAFLYTGNNPLQVGVKPGTIDCARAAVIRGKVQGADGKALASVRVTIQGHSELGSTISRGDGMFDLAVNGGGSLVVQYASDGYLSAWRRVEVPWHDYYW